MTATANTIARSRRVRDDRNINVIMGQRHIRFDPIWAIAAIAIGILLGLAVSVGAGRQVDWQFLVYSAFMGLCIYVSTLALHFAVNPNIERLRGPLRNPARIGLSILGGVVGSEIGYGLLVFA